ncbi:hypothetical protein ATZ36_12670 [Candidatus Endomicrobiellum trichonymphae]|uniref:Uncharacterized protein n=1 Tax=Endomicrobium trichonymphae TaxID=1408204 RepID=A0A1E5IMX1_ENDTX|nr:hypothetical protein ATZ36_12670 [Candidatus Endomicrobium trichonymphae]
MKGTSRYKFIAEYQFRWLKSADTNILPVKAGISRIETVTSNVAENKSNSIYLNDGGRVVTYA